MDKFLVCFAAGEHDGAVSNRRDDAYDGSLDNRATFPAQRPVAMRVSGTDWAEGGWDIAQTIVLAKALEARRRTSGRDQ